jgi:hypothetical protein
MQNSVLPEVPKVPQKVKSIWDEKKRRGDVARLTAYTGLSKPTIIKALRHGIARPELVLKISKYFSKQPLTNPLHLEQKALDILKETA